MNSPIIETLFSQILINNHNDRPVYLQISDEILMLIKNGKLGSNQKLPSSREISKMLGVNRVTVSKAFEELQAQGWLESFVGRGTFVSSHIPTFEPKKLQDSIIQLGLKTAGFKVNNNQYMANPYFIPTSMLHLDDGYPDPKQAPLQELYRAYRNQLTRSGLYDKFGAYGSPDGSEMYRDSISKYLNETRNLKTTKKNILSIRGTLMGINLVCTSLINPGDVIVSGIPGWQRAEHNFLHARAKHIGIPIDENGIIIEELENICKKTKVRMVYVTPHHHYPTTVSLRIDRRLELLRLANEYGFIIFEDDYDFDFHYNNRPLLPLASADENGMVIYCGSFSKSFSPAFRMGYLVASENVIEHLANVRILLDRQGDHILDNAMAEILTDGTVQRYTRKALSVYYERRDYFCSLLKNELGDIINFSVPEGGMTVWAEFEKNLDLKKITEQALKKGLYFSDGSVHQYASFNKNATRLGFASSTTDNLSQSIDILKRIVL